jgi:hypothetical protein
MGEHATSLGPYGEDAAPTPELAKTNGDCKTMEESTDATPEGSHAEQPKPDLPANAPLEDVDGENLQGPQLEGHYPFGDGACEHHEAEKQAQGDDIENMVNLLETVSVPKVRPASIASMPEEVHEIPDEE